MMHNPKNFTSISDYAYYYAKKQPGVEAMVLGNNRVSYAEMAQKIDDCARALIGAGIKKGDRVATLCTPSPDFFVLFLATSSIGAVWVGLNPKYTIDELNYVVQDSRPTIIFSRQKIGDRDYSEDLVTLKEGCETTQSIVILGGVGEAGHDYSYNKFLQIYCADVSTYKLRQRQGIVEPKDPALIVYTSGTTGKPKGALLPHGGLISCCEVQNDLYPCSPLSVVNFLPINHIGCVGDISAVTLVAGGTLFFMEKFDPEASLKLMSDEKITLWGGVPTTFQMCLDLPNFDQFDLSSLKLILWSGAAASQSLAEELAKICPRLCNCYGQTETVGSIAFVLPGTDIDVLTKTIGKPPEGYDVQIVNERGEPVEDGVTGEIVVKGDFVMVGYWERPEATASTIDEEGWLHTGDLGQRRPDGNISLVGRIKEVFKSGGYNVYPREIEHVLESFPGVAMAAVIPKKDDLFGEVGYAFVLAPLTEIDERALQEHCRDHLANYKIPKKLFIRKELPILPIGKIDKQALKKTIVSK